MSTENIIDNLHEQINFFTPPPPCIDCNFYNICATKKMACKEFLYYVTSPYKKKLYYPFHNLSTEDIFQIKNIKEKKYKAIKGYQYTIFKKIKEVKFKNNEYKNLRFSEHQIDYIHELLNFNGLEEISKKIEKLYIKKCFPLKKIYNSLFEDGDEIYAN